MKAVTVESIAKALGTKCAITDVVTNICTDSREAKTGSLFIAINGERVNGHDYIEKALGNGAACVLAQEDRDYTSPRVIVVEDSVKAMLTLSAWYRAQLPVNIVAITGSVGKTTTKDMVAAVLGAEFEVTKTMGNQNNEIGMPRTIFEIEESTQVSVVEMGMCGMGEIAELAQAAKPNIGVITNIGVSHIELLGSRENILKAKLELAEELADGADLYLCADNELLNKVEIPRLNVIYYGVDNSNADIKGDILNSTPLKTDFVIHYAGNAYTATLPGVGKHLVQNALASFGIGVSMGMSPQKAIEALGNYTPSGMRQKVVETNGVTVVEDCYNASPDSIKAALATLGDFVVAGKKYMVLSDMLELGEISVQSHYDCGVLTAQSGADCLVCVGDYAESYAKGARDSGLDCVHYFASKAEVSSFLEREVKAGDLVWFKASRGMKLEDCINSLYEYLSPNN